MHCDCITCSYKSSNIITINNQVMILRTVGAIQRFFYLKLHEILVHRLCTKTKGKVYNVIYNLHRSFIGLL